MTSQNFQPRESRVEQHPAGTDVEPVAFGSNAVRLSLREWAIVTILVALAMVAIPRLWERFDSFTPGPDYRVPHALSEDYWLYQRLVAHASEDEAILVMGDSVVWGEYVAPQETLSRYLNEQDRRARFVNGGVNGAHPLALSGLVRISASNIRGRRVILHCNLLWMSSAERDLQTEGEFLFNHPRLVPQFTPWIRCYKAWIDERLGNVVDRHVSLRQWAQHLRIAFLDQQDLHGWSLDHPYENPMQRVRTGTPAPVQAPHTPPRTWQEQGIQTQDIPWIDLDTSLQWQAFRDSVRALERRGNRVFVLVGPFNEHLLSESSRRRYADLKAKVATWLEGEQVPYFLPGPLPSNECADASHPISAGYARLAEWMLANEEFAQWMEDGG